MHPKPLGIFSNNIDFRKISFSQSSLRAQFEQLYAKLDHHQQQEKGLWTQIRTARQAIKAYQKELADLEADYQAKGWLERPHSKLAKTRRKLAAAQKRKERAWRNLQKMQESIIS